jgi:hypothetical protein
MQLGTFSTVGSRRPLLVHDAGSLKDNEICGAQTLIPKSVARQPAVGVIIVLATGNDFVISGYGHERERRTSARRGCGGASVVGNVPETHL